jgi:predicted enzyme related to lactoylglutathione lyase
LCLPVVSIAAARSLAVAHGGAIKSPQHEWEARGFRACDGYDPEGNVIQVRESAT